MKFHLPDMHRSGTAPEWEAVPQAERNPWQIRAAATHGIDTPGNRETLKGVAYSTAGILAIDNGATATGTALIGWGRWKDIRDGKRAAETSTKGPKGEALDAVADSGLLAYALPVMERRGIISSAERKGITGLTVAKFVTASAAKLAGREMHTERINKFSMLLMWGGIGTHLLSKIAEEHDAPKTAAVVDTAGRALTYTGIGLGVLGMVGYARQLYQRKN